MEREGWEGGREKGDREAIRQARRYRKNCRDAWKLADPRRFSARSAIAGSPARHTTKERRVVKVGDQGRDVPRGERLPVGDRESRSRTGANESERLRGTCARALTYYRGLKSVPTMIRDPSTALASALPSTREKKEHKHAHLHRGGCRRRCAWATLGRAADSHALYARHLPYELSLYLCFRARLIFSSALSSFLFSLPALFSRDTRASNSPAIERD